MIIHKSKVLYKSDAYHTLLERIKNDERIVYYSVQDNFTSNWYTTFELGFRSEEDLIGIEND